MEKFKALTFNGTYVDMSKLNSGIYYSTKPTIFTDNVTLERLIKDYYDLDGANFLGSEYIENLKECRLTSIIITKDEI